MKIIGEKSLSSIVKILLDFIFITGIGIYIGLPFLFKWYMEGIYGIMSRKIYLFLLILLYITGLFALIIVQQIRKIFKTLERQNPFMMDNVKNLNTMGIFSFLIAFAYVFKIIIFNSFLTIIVVIIFTIAGFFSIILAEVFKQAVEAKEENDFTI